MKRGMMRLPVLSCLIPVLCIAGCTQFPQLDAVQSEGVRKAPYPALIPLADLVDQPTAPGATVEARTQLEAQAEGLQSRADGLSGREVAQSADTAERLAGLREKAAELRAQEP
ncbi:hypothetical protein [Sagittula sp. SSi028]|uniref:hypothetical protein n=1 Tax=Sagittula sp. SSi028 TaxID=3400636 RepID=UPI003AF89003